MSFEVFNNENLGSVRVAYATEDGSAWFVAKDVCDILGIKNSRQALTRLESDEISDVILNDTRSKGGATQRRTLKTVSESGLYALIMSSRKKEAVDFQRWITREVLPSIRKHGAYVMGQENMAPVERESMLVAIENLAAEKGFFESDGNYWFEQYQKMTREYAEVSEELVKAKKYLRKNNGGIEPAEPKYKSGFILREEGTREGVWTDAQMFVQNIESGTKYSIVEREMR